MSKPQPYNWKVPLPQQPPEPMCGAPPFDVAHDAALQPAPHTLATQAIAPVTGQVPAPMMTTVKHPVHAELPIAQGLRIARPNRANVQDPREEFTFQIPSPNVHAPQVAADVAARIVEPSLSKPFMFRGLSPSASVLHNPPTPVQQAWSGSNTPSYAVGQKADIQGTDQSFPIIDTAEGPIDMKEIATIFWRVEQGVLEERAGIAHNSWFPDWTGPSMNLRKAVPQHELNKYLPLFATLVSTSTTAQIPGEAFVSTKQQSTTTAVPFNEGVVQGHPYLGAMSYTQQGAYNHRSEYFHSEQQSINDAAARPPASYLQGQPVRPDPSLVPHNMLASYHYQNHAQHPEQVGYATAEATGQSYSRLRPFGHPGQNQLREIFRGHVNGEPAVTSNGFYPGHPSPVSLSSHEDFQRDPSFGHGHSPATGQTTNTLDELKQQETHGIHPTTGKPVVLHANIIDFVSYGHPYHRFCPIGRCRKILSSVDEVNNHFRTSHPEVFIHSTSPVECPYLGCSQIIPNWCLEDHLRREHLSEPIDRGPRCMACNKALSSWQYVKTHLHKKCCKCERCPGYIPSDAYEMREHRLGHLKDDQLEADEQPKAKKQKTTRG